MKMTVQHELSFNCTCPVGRNTDTYVCILTLSKFVLVEELVEAVKKLAKKPQFQEDVTFAIAKHLKCKVETIGDHHGVRTTVVVE